MRCKEILIVEDEPDIREVLRQVLEMEGYEPRTASNGREAMESLQSESPPCLILLDLMMPVMNGWEFLEEYRKKSGLAAVPVVVVSAVADRGKAPRADGFIRKPVELESLLATIKQYCG